MEIYKPISSGFSHLGQTFAEARDIWVNGRALYLHSDLGRKKTKKLTLEEACELQILHTTNRSRLFIFRDYVLQSSFTPVDVNAKRTMIDRQIHILPIIEQPASLSSTFFKESALRIAKATAILALAILTSPIWILALAGSYAYDSKKTSAAIESGWKTGIEHASWSGTELKIDLPPEPANSHISSDDVIRIGRSLIGYRHVSSEDLAQENATKGIPDGCSLNISFCRGERDNKALFKDLYLKIKRGEDCGELIKQYETAITDFILSSIGMDFEHPPATYREFLSSIDRTRFMLVRTGWPWAADVRNYGRLGRFPKENISPEGIFLLRRITREELGIPSEFDKKPITSPGEYGALANYLASHYRRELLCYLREEFDPELFNSIDLPIKHQRRSA